jgi:pimeloyl-ACP methyl ester carboxylesterase
MRLLAFLAVILAGCAAPPEGLVASTAAYQEHRVMVPVEGGRIFTRLCLPASGATQALVLINHGSPPRAEQRPGMSPAACNSEAVRWFLARGHAVGLPMRRGYGASGGAWAEAYGRCDSPDFRAAGLETAADIQAALTTLAARPDVAPGPALIIGQSAGGWGVLALAAGNPAGVGAYVNMAGGRGGWRDNTPRNNCSPSALVRAAGEFGATSRGPMLWVYTENDSFFGPALAGRMHAAFTEAGGQARMERLGPWGRDGHNMFFGNNGSQSWGPLVADFLAGVSGVDRPSR